MKAHKYWSLEHALHDRFFLHRLQKIHESTQIFLFRHTVLYDHGYLVRSQNDHSLKKIAGKRMSC